MTSRKCRARNGRKLNGSATLTCGRSHSSFRTVSSAEECQRVVLKLVQMKVNVLVDNTEITVNVQEGNQSFKWLAQIVESRLQALRRTKVIVNGIYNELEELIDPRQLICEHATWLNDNWTVKAKILSEFPSDEWGNPIYDEWTACAYLTKDHTFKWALEMDSWRSQLNEMDECGQALPSAEMKSKSSSMIQIGGNPDISTSFELDWSIMKWDFLSHYEVVEGYSEGKTAAVNECIESLKKVLESRYEIIIRLFIHYCGAGELGQRYGMTRLEFVHLLRLSQVSMSIPNDLFSSGSDAKGEAEDEGAELTEEQEREKMMQRVLSIVYRIFVETSPVSTAAVATSEEKESKATTNLKPVETKLFSRAHFTMALVSVALRMCSDDENDNNSSIPSSDLSSIVAYLLDEKIAVYWEKINQKYTMYQCLQDDVFVSAYSEYYYLLKRVYLALSDSDKRKTGLKQGEDPCLPVDTAIGVLKETLFMGSALQVEDIQGSIMDNCLALQFNPTPLREFNSIVFVEFLELIAATALVAIDKDSSGLSVGKRIRMCFNMISQVIVKE